MFNVGESANTVRLKTPETTGAQGGNRTRDLRITSALLYRLSYLGAEAILGAG